MRLGHYLLCLFFSDGTLQIRVCFGIAQNTSGVLMGLEGKGPIILTCDGGIISIEIGGRQEGREIYPKCFMSVLMRVKTYRGSTHDWNSIDRVGVYDLQ